MNIPKVELPKIPITWTLVGIIFLLFILLILLLPPIPVDTLKTGFIVLVVLGILWFYFNSQQKLPEEPNMESALRLAVNSNNGKKLKWGEEDINLSKWYWELLKVKTFVAWRKEDDSWVTYGITPTGNITHRLPNEQPPKIRQNITIMEKGGLAQTFEAFLEQARKIKESGLEELLKGNLTEE